MVFLCVHLCVPLAGKVSVSAVLTGVWWAILRAFFFYFFFNFTFSIFIEDDSKSCKTEASFSSESDVETHLPGDGESNQIGFRRYGT